MSSVFLATQWPINRKNDKFSYSTACLHKGQFFSCWSHMLRQWPWNLWPQFSWLVGRFVEQWNCSKQMGHERWSSPVNLRRGFLESEELPDGICAAKWQFTVNAFVFFMFIYAYVEMVLLGVEDRMDFPIGVRLHSSKQQFQLPLPNRCPRWLRWRAEAFFGLWNRDSFNTTKLANGQRQNGEWTGKF